MVGEVEESIEQFQSLVARRKDINFKYLSNSDHAQETLIKLNHTALKLIDHPQSYPAA